MHDITKPKKLSSIKKDSELEIHCNSLNNKKELNSFASRHSFRLSSIEFWADIIKYGVRSNLIELDYSIFETRSNWTQKFSSSIFGLFKLESKFLSRLWSSFDQVWVTWTLKLISWNVTCNSLFAAYSSNFMNVIFMYRNNII